MKNIKKIFYEEAYPKDRKPVKQKGTLGIIYNLLKNFEIHREDTAFSLLSGGGTFVDIGCGDGSLVFKASKKYQKCIGLEIAGTRMDFAEKKKAALPVSERKKIEFIETDADLKLPLKNNSVQALTMIASLEHFFDPYGVLTEVKRIMAKKSELILQVPNIAFLPRRISLLFGNLPDTSEDDTGWDGGHLHYFTVESLRIFLKKFGFHIETVTCSGIFALLRRNFVSLLGADIIIKARKIK